MSKENAKLMLMNDEERAIYLAKKSLAPKKSNGKSFVFELDKTKNAY